jgi:hypothetical protein
MWRISFGLNFRSAYYATTAQLGTIITELIEGATAHEINEFFASADCSTCYYYTAIDGWIGRVKVEACAEIV